MSKRYHTDSVQEFQFCKSKVLKILAKQKGETPVNNQRLKRQIRKFIVKMKEIETHHSKMGWPHPDADFSSEASRDLQKQLELMRKAPGKNLVANPDGSLYQKEGNLVDPAGGFKISNKGLVKPDGTPFETPVMPGAVMSTKFHSEDKIKEYLEKQDDSFLRTEE